MSRYSLQTNMNFNFPAMQPKVTLSKLRGPHRCSHQLPTILDTGINTLLNKLQTIPLSFILSIF